MSDCGYKCVLSKEAEPIWFEVCHGVSITGGPDETEMDEVVFVDIVQLLPDLEMVCA